MRAFKPPRPNAAKILNPAEETMLKMEPLVSPHTGIIQSIYEHRLAPDDPDFFIFTAKMADTSAFGPLRANQFNGGCSVERGRALACAVGETVERYCASIYDEDSLVFASADELGSSAVDPSSFVLFSEYQYDRPDFRFSRFERSLKIRWTKGYSLTRAEERYVPACMIYVPYQKDRSEQLVDYSTTTGLAAANTLEEALLSGLYEVIERDAFMTTWLNRRSAEGLKLIDCRDPMLQDAISRYEHAPIKLMANDITTELDIATVLITIISRNDLVPSAAVGAAARLNPVKAAIKALEETAHTRFWIKTEMEEAPKTKIEKDFSNITNLAQHPLLYGSPSMAGCLAFLYSNPQRRSLERLKDLSTGSVWDDIEICVRALSDRGYEVIFVDVTTPDIEDVGFKVVKVLIPGLQPLDVGIRYRHLGGRRLAESFKALGYEGHPPEPNPYPHPYP